MDTSRRRRLLRGLVTGIVATMVALGVAELVASLGKSLRSPVFDVGNRIIDGAPRPVKDFAISAFGTNDKTALLAGIGILLAIYAVVIGVLAMRRRWIGVAGVGLFAVIGIVSASTGPTATAVSWIPSLVGGLARGATVWFLASLGQRPDPALDGRQGADPTGASAHPGVARRSFLIAAGGLGGAAVIATTTGRWLSERFDVAVDRARLVLPRARTPIGPMPADVAFAVKGLTPFVTPNSDFYRIDTALTVPQVSVDEWTLAVRGMVDKPIELTFDELTSMDVVESDITLTCVSNEIGGTLAGNARWLGVPLRDVLSKVGISPKADQIVGRSVDGFTAGFPVVAGTDDRGALIAVGMNGEPLPIEHGFPARLIVPGLYGYVSATKWLTELEVTRFDAFDAYWAERDWSTNAPIKTFSRIDTPGPLATVPAGRHPVAGVAWAQGRGIDRVEVRVDGGAWADARLAAALNDVTWRQWMLPLDFDPGRHSIECRATDGTGERQTETRAAPFPNGASGWHSVVVIAN